MAAVKRTAQTGTTNVSSGSAAVGDRVYLYALTDTASATLTPPSDGQTWHEIDQGSEVGAASSTLGGWYADMVGSVPATFAVGGATIAVTKLFIINPNGDVLGTPDMPNMTTDITAVVGTITSPVVNATAYSFSIFAYSADDQSTVAVAPPLLVEDSAVSGTGCSLALYSAADANDATFSDTLTWSTGGTERMCIGLSQPITAAPSGPTINTQPSASTSRLHGDASVVSSFVVAATTSGGALSYQWQKEDSVGAGTYSNISNGGVYAGVTTTTLTVTPTDLTLTGLKYRCNVTDSNGTTATTGATLTVLNGPTLSKASGTTNGSGVDTLTVTTDDVTNTNGEYVEITATLDGVVARTSVNGT